MLIIFIELNDFILRRLKSSVQVNESRLLFIAEFTVIDASSVLLTLDRLEIYLKAFTI